MNALDYIEQRKKQILEDLKTDHQISADPYANVARLKEIEKIRKILIHERKEACMAYTPELNASSSCTLRRIAWWLDKPMTYAIAWVIGQTAKHIDSESVCKACQDRSKCSNCPFNGRQ